MGATRVCTVCGKEGTKAKPLSRKSKHFECGLRNAVEWSRQLHAKSGPLYEQWVKAVERRNAYDRAQLDARKADRDAV